MTAPYPVDTVESERDLQSRVARFGGLVFLGSLALMLAGLATRVAAHDVLAPGESTLPHELLHASTLALPLVAWLRCRANAMSRRAVEIVDAALTISTCLLYAALGRTGTSVTGAAITFSVALGVAYVVFGRSILVPSSFRRTLTISCAATAPAIAYFAMHAMPMAFTSRESENLFVAFGIGWCVFTIVASAANSRELYGLRARIREIGKLGQYTLAEKLGEGGMGTVYRATHAMLRRPAAIKLLQPDRSSAADLARFEREVQLTTRLAHPNTISIFDYGRTPEGVFYYVMEYLDGMDLDRLVESEGPLEPARVIRILSQVSGALAEAHTLGLVHRDIKPANIVLTERADEPDVVKVVDFGLVKTLEKADAQSSANVVAGTPMYMAPEAVTAASTIDGRADIYALGAVAYYLLTGKHVFEGQTVLEVCGKHVFERPEPPSQRLGKSLPADLERVVLDCLAKKPEERPASAAALRASLLACEDASRYDAAAARTWWRERGGILRASARTPVSGTAPTVTIELHGR
ncbi:MAG: serine/threonine-protein kinase [Polyangiales bacterium]